MNLGLDHDTSDRLIQADEKFHYNQPTNLNPSITFNNDLCQWGLQNQNYFVSSFSYMGNIKMEIQKEEMEESDWEASVLNTRGILFGGFKHCLSREKSRWSSIYDWSLSNYLKLWRTSPKRYLAPNFEVSTASHLPMIMWSHFGCQQWGHIYSHLQHTVVTWPCYFGWGLGTKFISGFQQETPIVNNEFT